MPRSQRPRSRLLQRSRPAPDLDRIAADLNRIYVRGGLQTAIAAGTVVLKEFFNGDIAAFRDREPGAWGSFRELCERDDLAMSRSYLAVCMDILVQLDDLPPGIGQQLSFTHHRTLLPVRDLEVKRRLARRTVRETLSSRGLRGLVQEEIGRGGPAFSTSSPRNGPASDHRASKSPPRPFGPTG